MFRPVPMLRLSVIVLERDERKVLHELGRLGILHLARTPAGPDSALLPARDRREEVARCARLLADAQELRRSLMIPAAREDQAQGVGGLEEAEEQLRVMTDQAGLILRKREVLLKSWSEATALSTSLVGYRGLSVPLDPPGERSFLHFLTGNLPPENLSKLSDEIGENVALLPLPERSGKQPLIAITTRRGRAALELALHKAGFEEERLPVFARATTDTLADESERARDKAAEELEQVNVEVRRLAGEYGLPLAAIERFADDEKRLLEAGENFARTEATLLITGWLPADDATGIRSRLRATVGERCMIEVAEPGRTNEDLPPTLLRHKRLWRPFEMLVTAYSLPNYRELEPTVMVAISYVLMFGMMFGDAGQGVVLAAAGLVAMLKCHSPRRRDVGLMLLLASLSSIVFGIVYGSYFGLENLKKFALWHDPLEGNPMALMYGAVTVGVLVIAFGLVLNIINRFRRRDVVGALLDKFGIAGAWFYLGALILITQTAAIRSHGLTTPALIVFLGLPVAAWVLKEPIEYLLKPVASRSAEQSGGLLVAFAESLVGAFEAVLSYLANTISFVRLAAYAMSHAALLVATFMVAAEVRSLPVGGDLLSVLVIILGNLVAIVLEGTIAAVQALRLEYYEFFSKFFLGNGQPFTPFRLVAREPALASTTGTNFRTNASGPLSPH